MPKIHKIIQSFNSGELSQLMDSRIDQNKYQSGCRTMENAIPLIYGGAQERPGLEHIAGQKSSSAKGRVVAFEHSVDDTYVLLFENQVLRFFKSGAQVFDPFGTEDLSDFDSVTGDSSLIAHWLLNDNLATTAVLDDTVAGSHDGTASSDTDTLTTSDESGTANKAFDMGGTDYVTVGDDNAFSFGDGSSDSPFSITAMIKYEDTGANQQIISKFHNGNNQLEWKFEIAADQLVFSIADESAGVIIGVRTVVTLDANWHFVGATYNGNESRSGITLYIDWVKQNTTNVGTGSYTAMEQLGADVIIGGREAGTLELWKGDLNNIAIFDKELSASEIANLSSTGSITPFEIVTPYLTADLPTLKFEQSADVMFITHPSYESRKLARLADTSWSLEASDLQTGPFRDQTTDTAKTITASAVTGSVTLTAVGHSPFIAGTTAGHLPSGALATSKSQTGALFKLVQGLSAAAQHVSGLLAVGAADVSTSTLSITKGTTWDLVTNGTWGSAADPATVDLERSYDSGTTYETVFSFTSAANYNAVTSETEEDDDALYRLTVKEAGGASNMAFNLSVRGTGHIGIVEITAVANPQSATATVLTTLASTDPTHRFSEGSFSNRRGWPIDVTISSEERLTFAGNVSEPLTTWGSVIGNFIDFKLGTNDDDALTLTLVGSGQQNRIRWMLSKNTLVLGTVGGEHILGASKDDEALTPTNIRARLQTTYGSENIAALIVNQAVLFVQRGGRKIREFLYSFEQDSHKADDLTVFAEHITESGIVDMAFQRTPDPMLWCVRSDGEMAIMTYERDQDVFSWARLVTHTNLAGTEADSDFESVAVIYGGAGNEDEVWVTVRRTISGVDARYVERFYQRAMPSAIADMKFLDSFITDTGGDTTIEGLTHLIGQTVQVLGDGLVQATKVVNGSGVITAATTATKYQFGV